MSDGFSIEDDKVIQRKPMYDNYYEVHTVITKDVFIECFKRWILDDWLSSFNTEPATACFTAVQKLKNRGEKGYD